MMTGSVSGRHALVPVAIRISGQPDLTIEFVLDTGFVGFLTLAYPVVVVGGLVMVAGMLTWVRPKPLAGEA